MEDPPAAEQSERYIAGYLCYGARPLSEDERNHLTQIAARHLRRRNLAWVFVALSLLAFSIEAGLVMAGRIDLVGILFVPGLIGSVVGVWIAGRSNSLRRYASRELEHGWVEGYGHPPEWNQSSEHSSMLEELVYAPSTRRVLWIQGRFFESVYDTPTKVAPRPPAYHNLAESGWLDDVDPVFRNLVDAEIRELRAHLSQRGRQAFLGLLGVAMLLTVVVGSAIKRGFMPGSIFLIAFGLPMVPVGWRAWIQQRELRRCLESGRVGMVKQRTDEGEVIVEFLEGSGVVWTIAGAAHPWRGVRGAQ